LRRVIFLIISIVSVIILSAIFTDQKTPRIYCDREVNIEYFISDRNNFKDMIIRLDKNGKPKKCKRKIND